jgi:hypothetical protein
MGGDIQDTKLIALEPRRTVETYMERVPTYSGHKETHVAIAKNVDKKTAEG